MSEAFWLILSLIILLSLVLLQVGVTIVTIVGALQRIEKRLAEIPTPAEIEALDGLARHAIAEHEAGRTRDIREFAKECGINLEELQ